MSNTDGEDTQKVSLGELLLNAGTRIVDLEKQSNDQVEIITHLEKQLASLREQLANSRDEVHELNVQTDNLNNELLMTKELLKQKEDENRDLKQSIKKYIFHWDKYFGSPVVGQPPSQEELRKLIKDDLSA